MPEEVGGGSLSQLGRTLLHEEAHRHGLMLSRWEAILPGVAGPAHIYMACDEEQRNRYLFPRMSGPKAGNNPWRASTLEWQCPSPPPHGNFAELPTVYRGPYEYSVPGRDKDYWPQNDPA